MQALSGTVGDGGANARHDAALVQAMLVQAKRPAALDPKQPKYLGAIDGDFGGNSKGALRQFQNDQVFVSADGRTSVAVAGAKEGLVVAGDPTWLKLVAAMPADFADMRVLTGSKTVYIPGTTAELSLARNLTGLTFEAAFRAAVFRLITQVYDDTGIVVSVCEAGDRRDFQTQYDLLTSGRNVTDAGPGESNHNYGQAVDLGFAAAPAAQERNRSGERGLVDAPARSQPAGRRRVAVLLGHAAPRGNDLRLVSRAILRIVRTGRLGPTRASTWPASSPFDHELWHDALDRTRSALPMRPGYGDRFSDMGSAAQIWNGQATVTAAILIEARAEQLRRYLHDPPRPLPVPPPLPVPLPPRAADLLRRRG